MRAQRRTCSAGHKRVSSPHKSPRTHEGAAPSSSAGVRAYAPGNRGTHAVTHTHWWSDTNRTARIEPCAVARANTYWHTYTRPSAEQIRTHCASSRGSKYTPRSYGAYRHRRGQRLWGQRCPDAGLPQRRRRPQALRVQGHPVRRFLGGAGQRNMDSAQQARDKHSGRWTRARGCRGEGGGVETLPTADGSRCDSNTSHRPLPHAQPQG